MTEVAFRRIIVALDSSPESLTALEMSAHWAETDDAELVGLFVEDLDLLNLAGLPFSTETSRLSAATRTLEVERLELEFQAQAALARRALEAAATRLRVRRSFVSLRGRVGDALKLQVTDADLLAIGRRRRALPGRGLGRLAADMASRLPCSVLLAIPGADGRHLPVGLIYEDSDCGGFALALAARHARQDRRSLVLFVMGDSAETREAKRRNAEARLGKAGLNVDWREIEGYGAEARERALRDQPLHLLAIGCDVAGGMRPESWLEIAERADCPVLLTKLPLIG